MKLAYRYILALPTLLLVLPGSCQPTDDLEQQVRKAELAFAQTMASRDLDAFATFVDEEAVFLGDQSVLRGRDAIRTGWSSFFEGADAPFSWEPETVVVLESGSLALSSGPVYSPDLERIGTFNSVWRRSEDGRWLVVFDKGCPPCPCDDEP